METSYTALKNRLDGFDGHNIQDCEDSSNFLETLSQPDNLRALLNEIRTNDQWLETISDRSYVHKNGFDKFKLIVSDDPEYKFRLHVWRPEILPQTEQDVDLHNHRWDFTSTLIAGNMRFMNYDLADKDSKEYEEFYMYKYPPRGSDESYNMKYMGTQPVKPRFGGILKKGVTYSISNEIIHSTFIPNQELTATLLIQGPSNQSEAMVLTSEKQKEGISNVSLMNPDMVANKIEKLLEKI